MTGRAGSVPRHSSDRRRLAAGEAASNAAPVKRASNGTRRYGSIPTGTVPHKIAESLLMGRRRHEAGPDGKPKAAQTRSSGRLTVDRADGAWSLSERIRAPKSSVTWLEISAEHCQARERATGGVCRGRM